MLGYILLLDKNNIGPLLVMVKSNELLLR